MKKKTTVLIYLLIALYQFSFTQETDSYRDSLRQQIPTATQEIKCKLYIQLARGFWFYNTDSIEANAKKAVQIAEQLNYQPLLAKAYKELGTAYYFMDSLALTISNYEIALNYFRKEKDTIGILRIGNNMGLIYSNMGLYKKALQQYINALDLARQIDAYDQFVNISNNVGNLYHNMEDYKKSEEYYLIVYDKVITSDDELEICKIKNNLGSVYIELKKYSKSERLLKSCDKIARKIKNNSNIITANNNLGRLFFEKEEFDKALHYYRISLAFSEKTQQLGEMANTTRNIAGVFLETEEYDSALVYFDKTSEIAKRKKLLGVHLPFLELDYAGIYEQLGDYKKALTYYTIYMHKKDSITKVSTSQEIAELRTIYDTKVKDFQNKYLTEVNNNQELEIKNQQYIIYLAISLIFIFFVLGILFFLRFRIVERHRKELLNKNSRISEQNIVMNKTLAKVRESEMKYKILVNNFQAGVCLIQNNEILFSNRLMGNIMVDQQQDLAGSYLEDFIVNKSIDSLKKTMLNVLKTKEPQSITVSTITDPNRELTIAFSYVDYLGYSALLCVINNCQEKEIQTTNSTPKVSKKPKSTDLPERTDSNSGFLKTLVIDDDELNLKYLSTILKKNDMEVLAINNGKDALQQFSTFQPKLILLDIQMPDMDGFQIAKKLRQIEKETGQTPCIIIAVTAFISENEEKEYKKAGMDFLLAKPFLPKDIQKLIKKVIPKNK